MKPNPFSEPNLESKKEYSLDQIDKCVSRSDWKSLKQIQDFCNLAILTKSQESAEKISLFERKNPSMKNWFFEADNHIELKKRIDSLDELREYQKMLGRSIVIRGLMLDAFTNDNFQDVKFLLEGKGAVEMVHESDDAYRVAYEALANAYDSAENNSEILKRKTEFLTKVAYGTLDDIIAYKNSMIQELSSEEADFLDETIKFRS